MARTDWAGLWANVSVSLHYLKQRFALVTHLPGTFAHFSYLQDTGLTPRLLFSISCSESLASLSEIPSLCRSPWSYEQSRAQFPFVCLLSTFTLLTHQASSSLMEPSWNSLEGLIALSWSLKPSVFKLVCRHMSFHEALSSTVSMEIGQCHLLVAPDA